MLNTDRINEIHRLFHGEHWSARKIAHHLHMARKTLRKYIAVTGADSRSPSTNKQD